MYDTIISLKNETLTYTGNHFHTTPSGAKEMLEKYGIAIIPDRLNSEECQQMNEGMWQTAEYLTSKLSKPLKRSDPTTYETVFQLESEMGGLIWNWGWGHAQYVWDVRSNPKVSEVFEEVFDTKDLLVSFDAINCNLGALTPSQKYTYKGKHNLHCDQRFTKNDFECVQTWLSANPVGVGDGTLRILLGIYFKWHRE